MNDADRIQWLANRHLREDAKPKLSAWFYFAVMVLTGWAAAIYGWAVVRFSKATRA
jgi:hypothetical protein